MTSNGSEDESKRERKKVSIKNKRNVRVEDSERLLQQCPAERVIKNAPLSFLFLT
jgi:hypothetical protein